MSKPWSRPWLEALGHEELAEALEAVSAETRRRGLVLSEQHEQRLLTLRAEIAATKSADRQAEEQRLAVTEAAREYDFQHAEALGIMWLERADKLRTLPLGEHLPRPQNPGPVLDRVLDALPYSDLYRLRREDWNLFHVLESALMARRGISLTTEMRRMGEGRGYGRRLSPAAWEPGNEKTPGVTPGSDLDHDRPTGGPT